MGTYVKFSKPYTFEDDVYEGVDLSGLSNLTGRNLNNIEKRFYKLGIASFNPENTVAYAQVVAQRQDFRLNSFSSFQSRRCIRLRAMS